MFTGLIEELGIIRSNGTEKGHEGGDWVLDIAANITREEAQLGDSISINGVCLTVIELDADGFKFGLAPETLNRTNLGDMKTGDRINLERCLTPTTRMGGHYVQGHVDGTGVIESFTEDGDALWVKIKLSPDLMRYIVPKGYVAIDGTSLTVVETGADYFTVTLIAYTQNHIALPNRPVGAKVNIEVDIIGKYVEKFVAAGLDPRLTVNKSKVEKAGEMYA